MKSCLAVSKFLFVTEIGTYLDFVTKYVIWDEVLDWERDIKDYGKKKERLRL